MSEQNGAPPKTCIFTAGMAMGSPQTMTKGVITTQQPQPISLSFACIKERCVFWHENKQKCRFIHTMDLLDDMAVNSLRVRANEQEAKR